MRVSLIWAVVTAIGASLLPACSGDPSPADEQPAARLVAKPGVRGGGAELSPTGELARRAREAWARGAFKAAPGGGPTGVGPEENLPRGPQGEFSVAVDDSGQHIVVGFNDFRGFLDDPLSISGFMYSDDGGRTFVDGGQLPGGTDDSLGVFLPQVFGDPDVKYLGGCNFIYTSIIIAKFSDVDVAQTIGFHRSRDCGHTWEGPFEIPPATNPNGLVVDGTPLDAADKEFIGVDRETGRVILSWTNFTPVGDGAEISTTTTDNILDDDVVWTERVVVGARPQDGQGSIPRFGRGDDAYVAWTSFPGGVTSAISFAKSSDGGATFGSPRDITAPFMVLDQILGNDRVHSFPSMAVDESRGRHRGNVYVAHARNSAQDGGDVVVQRSTDRGATFSAPVVLSSRPGDDRAQWFPWVTVDSSGRVFAFFFDQGIAASGDLTQVSYTFSDDGGVRWAQPRPLSSRPFHAGWGNDTGQPNLGDYNQAVTANGDLIAAFASTHPVRFDDNQPDSPFFSVPEPAVPRVPRSQHVAVTSVDLQDTRVTVVGGDRDGSFDPGETALVSFTLRNYVTNPMNARAINGAVALVDSPTPGVSVPVGIAVYRTLDPGETDGAVLPAVVRLGAGFEAGRDVELRLRVFSLNGLPMTLFATLHTGTPSETVLIAESFEGVAPGALPAGWTAAHGAGANVVPWTTRTGFCGGSNAAFHQNVEDGVPPLEVNGSSRWERLFSPMVAVPADADTVFLDFDVCYDLEDDPGFDVLAYDGLFLRVLDATPGHILRSVLVEAFDDDFTTGGFFHYPQHLPRSGDPSYFEDMSVWSGDSAGVQHVRLRLRGMEGNTVQLRFEFTQDFFVTCSDVRPGHACGVSVDNVRLRSVTFGP